MQWRTHVRSVWMKLEHTSMRGQVLRAKDKSFVGSTTMQQGPLTSWLPEFPGMSAALSPFVS